MYFSTYIRFYFVITQWVKKAKSHARGRGSQRLSLLQTQLAFNQELGEGQGCLVGQCVARVMGQYVVE